MPSLSLEGDGGQRGGILLVGLASLSTRSREIILTNMRQLASLTLVILKSLYPRADLDVAGEGFVLTCSDEEALKLIEDSAVMAG
jgi:hypothetical protein